MAATVAKPATPGAQSMAASRTANKTAATPTDPFAPMSGPDIQATIARLTGGLPGAMSGSQIQTTAQGELDPIIAAITKNIQGQASQASSQIGSNAAAIAAALGKIDYGAPYDSAKSDQAAVDAALQQSVNGEGSSLASDLRTRLGQIDDPTVGAAASGLASRGTALGTTELAHGSNALSALIANAAAAKEYGTQQPGIVQRQGLQDVAGVNAKATQSISDEAAKIEESLPGIVQSLRSESNSNQSTKAQLASRLWEVLTGQNLTRATAEAAIGGKQAQLQQTGAYDAGKLSVAEQNAQTAASRASTAAAKANAPKTGTPIAAKDAIKLADDLRFGIQPKMQWDSKNSRFVPVPGTGQPNSSYEEAYQQLVAAGLAPQKARVLVNSRYKPGEYGRPLTKAQQKTAAAVKSGVGVPKTTGQFAGLGG